MGSFKLAAAVPVPRYKRSWPGNTPPHTRTHPYTRRTIELVWQPAKAASHSDTSYKNWRRASVCICIA